MSFLKPKTHIDQGDVVILYLSVNSMHAIEAVPTIVNKKGEVIAHIFQTPYGSLKVESKFVIKIGMNCCTNTTYTSFIVRYYRGGIW